MVISQKRKRKLKLIAYKAAEAIDDQFEGTKSEIREQIRYAIDDFKEGGFENFNLTKDEEIDYVAKQHAKYLRAWLL